MVYLNYIKRILAYAIKLLVYTEVLKKITFFNPISTYKEVYTQLRFFICWLYKVTHQ